MAENIKTDPMQALADNAERMMKGYQNLLNVEEVDIATAPKTQVWKRDKVTLYRYNRDTPATVSTPVLIVYALVNRQDMMDLQPDRSYIRNLLAQGLDLYIIDWGYATDADRYLTLDDYVNGYINSCVNHIRKEAGVEKVSLMGVCQGGTMCTMYAALHPEKVKNLVTMVTPIEFSTNDGLLFKWARNIDIDKVVDTHGTVPGEFLNSAFSMLKPMMKAAKVQNAMGVMDDPDKLMNYLRMERWINDSPNQAGEAFRQFIKDLYQNNKLVKGELELDGKRVDLKNITCPLMNIYAEQDHLVPPASSIPLADYVGSKDKETYKFPGGHIGVFVGSRSQKELAPAVSKWLGARDK